MITNAGSIDFDQFVLGAPNTVIMERINVPRILASPTGPLANDVFVPAYNNSLLGGAEKKSVDPAGLECMASGSPEQLLDVTLPAQGPLTSFCG